MAGQGDSAGGGLARWRQHASFVISRVAMMSGAALARVTGTTPVWRDSIVPAWSMYRSERLIMAPTRAHQLKPRRGVRISSAWNDS